MFEPHCPNIITMLEITIYFMDNTTYECTSQSHDMTLQCHCNNVEWIFSKYDLPRDIGTIFRFISVYDLIGLGAFCET